MIICSAVPTLVLESHRVKIHPPWTVHQTWTFLKQEKVCITMSGSPPSYRAVRPHLVGQRRKSQVMYIIFTDLHEELFALSTP